MKTIDKLLLALAAWAVFAALVFYGPTARAAGFVDEPTCYSWSGGHKSAGSFSKCNPEVQAFVAPPRPVPAPAPTAVVVSPPSPIMMPMQSCAPPAPLPVKPKTKHRPKPTHKC